MTLYPLINLLFDRTFLIPVQLRDDSK